MEKIKIGGILSHDSLAMLHIHGMGGGMGGGSLLLYEFGVRKINLQFIVHVLGHSGQDQFIMAIDKEDCRAAFDMVVALQDRIAANTVKLKQGVATIGIYGPDFRLRPGIAGNFLKCLTEQGIPVFAIATSVSTCSALIPEDQSPKAKSAIESYFILP